MLLEHKIAEGLTREKVAEMATEFANRLARKLGSEKTITISPDEIITDKYEAIAMLESMRHTKLMDLEMTVEGRIKSGGMPAEAKKALMDIALPEINRGYDLKLENIEKCEPSFYDEFAFIPLTDPAEEELYMVHSSKKGGSFKSLNGFASEIGHLVCAKLYGNHPLSEAVDALALFLEMDSNMRQVGADSFKLDKGLHSVFGGLMADTLKPYEVLLFEGEKAFKNWVSEKWHGADPEQELERLREDYIHSSHYVGLKLFNEVMKASDDCLDRAFKTMGELLSMPQTKSPMRSCLAQLGWTNEQILKYEPFFDSDPYRRMELMEDICSRKS